MNKLSTLLLLLCSFQTQASLINRGKGLIFDSIQNLTWVQNPLLAVETARFHLGDINKTATLTLASNGRSNFGDIAVLYNLNSTNYLGHNDWRRPTTVSTVTGVTTREAVLAELTGSNVNGELANLFRNNDTSIFNNITDQVFWAGNQQLADPAHGVFSNNGVLMYQVSTNTQILVNRQTTLASEWAVRDGDVSPTLVPMSPTVLFFITGILTLLLLRPNRLYIESANI